MRRWAPTTRPASTTSAATASSNSRRASPTSPRPAASPRHTLRPADLVAAAFLETEADIDAFLSTLHAELKAALDRGQRIQIR